MWLYISFCVAATVIGSLWYKSSTPTDIITQATNGGQAIVKVVRCVRQHGLGICLQWTRQIVTNQITKHLIEMHHKYYVIHYPYGVTWYKIVIPRKRGPCLIAEIRDSGGNNVMDVITPYMGPSHNFHNQQISPKILGFEELLIVYIDGTEKKFTGNDVITV